MRGSCWIGLLLGVLVHISDTCGATVLPGNPELLAAVDRAVEDGRFGEAEQLLLAELAAADESWQRVVTDRLELIRRRRLNFSLSPAELLERVRKSIPDVTPADLDRWRALGQLQGRIIDGQVAYFSAEPKNLFRFCAAARARRQDTDSPPRAGWKFDLVDHLVRLVNRADQTGQASVFPVQQRITYRLAVKPNVPLVKPGANVRCWLPFPQEYRQQQKVRLVAARPAEAMVAPNGHPQRTIYFEQTIADPAQPPVFEVTYEFETSGYCPPLHLDQARPMEPHSPLAREFTAERAPHIVFTPAVRAIVNEVAGEDANPLSRARKLFRWVSQNIDYCSELEYSTIENLSAKALQTRRGDCGVQAMLFITLCRAAGIPARWQSGWETKPNGWNMHDWAEFYVEPWGWLPADPSYGLQSHPDPRVAEFYCGGLDPYRLIVNLDYGRTLMPAKTSLRSEPADFQRGEIEIDGQNLYFDQWTWSFRPRTLPLTGDFDALAEALDGIVPDLLDESNIPGAVLLVGQRAGNEFRIWQKAYGWQQRLPRPRTMTADAVFDMASLTKPLATGTSLMLLADQGRLDIDDPVSKYLPEFAAGPKSQVTIKQLMTHMSGEPPYVGAADQKKIEATAGFPCPAAIRQYIRELDLVRAPGAAMQYSCLNAILCAELVRTISGEELSDFARRHVFEPLAMHDTQFCPLAAMDPRLVPTERREYGRGEGGFLLGQVHDPLAAMQAGVSGNAGLFSTAADLSRFAQMLLNHGELDGVRILQPETVRRMTSVQNPGARTTAGVVARRGLLWDVYPPDPGDTGVDALYAYGHTGYTGTAMRLYPDQGVYVIALTNRVHPDDSAKVARFRREVWRTVGEAIMGVVPGP